MIQSDDGSRSQGLAPQDASPAAKFAVGVLDVDTSVFWPRLLHARQGSKILVGAFGILMRRKFRHATRAEVVEEFVHNLPRDLEQGSDWNEVRARSAVIRRYCGVPLVADDLRWSQVAKIITDILRQFSVLDDASFSEVRLALVEAELRLLLKRRPRPATLPGRQMNIGPSVDIERLQAALGYSEDACGLKTVEGKRLRARMLGDKTSLRRHTSVSALKWRVTEAGAWSAAMNRWFGSRPEECEILFGSQVIARRYPSLGLRNIEAFLLRESGYGVDIAGLDGRVLNHVLEAIPVVYGEHFALSLPEIDEFCRHVETFMLKEIAKLGPDIEG